MPFKLEWKPVLQALALKEYHEAYDGNVIMVCVNPKPEFLQERATLMNEYSRRLFEAQAAAQKSEVSGQKEDQQDATAKATAFSDWCEMTFLPGMQRWFAALWSFGDEQFTTIDLDAYDREDPHFLTWAKRRSIDLIEAHGTARKKA